jgi:hypothetical protein
MLQIEHNTDLQKVQYTCNTMVSSVEIMKLLCRLELMTGSGRRRSAMEMADEGEDVQIEEILTPEDNRY